ncbi:transposase ISLbp1 [Clostridium sartagoforme AAU1]|uniref:Transposase ISLbp1 n=1 Tax=Clostridium sartagoforme AAU1 TaxID=1202534 RepID=R9CEQ8_9CLOT|nr:IS4 family transposase [Clostridium sartagoforme]EOR27510.1 transposase ISLbp1 [Clostridium sartagoforme AAU1]
MINAYERIKTIFDKLSNERIKEIGKINANDFTRNRKMNFEDILRFILSKKGKSTTMEINNYFKELNKREDRVTKQAFCKQRLKLNPQVFIELNKEYIKSIYDNSNYKTYKNYILTAVDGTILEVPNTEELRDCYGCINPSKENVRKTARAKASGIYDVENNIMIDALIDKYNTPERALAKRNIQNMIDILGTDRKILTIFDRGYISTEMLLFLLDFPIYYIFRVQGNTYNSEKESMQSDDQIVEMKTNGQRLVKIADERLKQKAKLLEKVPVRMVKITLDTGEDEYLVTNIPIEEIGTEEMGALYFKRWGIETAYDVLKNKLYIENISGKKKIIVEQDFYAQILLFNMVEDLKNDANSQLQENKNENLKYDYKVNMNILIGTFREYVLKIALEDDNDNRRVLYTSMLEEILENLIPVRDGRKNPRTTYKGKNKYRTNFKRNS